MLTSLGTQRDRYRSASELQSYSGIAPVLASSGKQCWVHWRWACPKFLRQTFHEPFQKLAEMLLDHLDGILNYCRFPVRFGVEPATFTRIWVFRLT